MAIRIIRKPRFLELPSSQSRTTMVCGSGRSGTTWIGDVVAAKTRSRILFEPFILGEDGEFQLANSHKIQLDLRKEIPYYISSHSSVKPNLKRTLSKILFGDYRCGWVDQDLKPGFYYRRVVKEIRANLLLDVISEFWPEIRIIYVIRSPYWVIDSMMEKCAAGWKFEWPLDEIMNQQDLMTDWLNPFVEQIQNANTLPERLMVRWCIENYIASNQLKEKHNVRFVSYEQLATGNGWDTIGDFLKDRGWVGEPSSETLSRISRTSNPSARSGNKEKYMHLNESDISKIDNFLHVFGLEGYMQIL